MKKIAVFASGNGSNFQVIAEQFPVEFVFSDHRDAYVLERAEKLGVPSYAFELKEFESKADYERAIVELLDEHQIDLVCLAGYMKIVGPTLLAAYEGRIINIHPAFLPEFPGAHGIEDAWNAGVDQSGVTIHWVDSGVDTGKVIKQVRVPRLEGDTLDTFETRIHETEYKLYPEVLRELGMMDKSRINVEKLKSSPLFAISLGGKELSHSNFWAWLINLEIENKHPFVEVFISNFYARGFVYDSCIREQGNRDISIYYYDSNNVGRCHIVENKLKSLPSIEQLEKYENNFSSKKFIFDAGTITGIQKVIEETNTWKFLSYSDISSRIKYILEGIDTLNEVSRDIITLYTNDISCLSDLLIREIEDSCQEYYFLCKPYLEEIKFNDVVLKYHANKFKNKLEDFLRENTNSLISKWGLPKVGISFHNKKSTISISYNQKEKGVDVGFIGIQLEGKQFRLHCGPNINSSKFSNNEYLFKEMLKLKYLETFTNKQIRQKTTSMTKKFCKYGIHIYQYWNIEDTSYQFLFENIMLELVKAKKLIDNGLDFR